MNVEITVNSEDPVTEDKIKNAIWKALRVSKEEINVRTEFQSETKNHGEVQSITVSLPDTYKRGCENTLRNFFYNEPELRVAVNDISATESAG